MPFPKREKKGPRPPGAPRKKSNPLPVIGGLTKGRPTSYKPEYDEMVYRLRLLGDNVEKIAKFFGVEVNTLYLWASKHPSFNESYARGGESADQQVIESLHRRAVGYEAVTQKALVVDKELEIVDLTMHIPADARAAEFWLINRRSAEWKSKQQEDQAGVTVNVVGGFKKDDASDG